MELPDPEDNKSVRRLPDINDVGHRLCAISEFKVKYDGRHMVYVVSKCKWKTGGDDTEEKLLDGESTFELSHYLLNWDVRSPTPEINIIKLGDDKISFERLGGWGYLDIKLTAQESAELLNAQLKAFKAFYLGNKNISVGETFELAPLLKSFNNKRLINNVENIIHYVSEHDNNYFQIAQDFAMTLSGMDISENGMSYLPSSDSCDLYDSSDSSDMCVAPFNNIKLCCVGQDGPKFEFNLKDGDHLMYSEQKNLVRLYLQPLTPSEFYSYEQKQKWIDLNKYRFKNVSQYNEDLAEHLKMYSTYCMPRTLLIDAVKKGWIWEYKPGLMVYHVKQDGFTKAYGMKEKAIQIIQVAGGGGDPEDYHIRLINTHKKTMTSIQSTKGCFYHKNGFFKQDRNGQPYLFSIKFIKDASDK